MKDGKAEYYLDKEKNCITRAVAGKAEGFDLAYAKAHGRYDVLLEKITDKDFSFLYCYHPQAGTAGYTWKDAWNNSYKIPRGIQVRLKDFIKTMFIPTGQLGSEE